MWDGFNQRKFPRVHLNCEIIIHPSDPHKPPIIACTENIGAGGVCVMQHEPLERFSVCRIRLELSKDIPLIECAGKVVWAIPKRDPVTRETSFDTGIEFVDMDPQDRDRIRSFIQEILPKGFQEIA